MSGSSLMALGLRAMTANYAALQTTGHNISNASVQGYSRQQVNLATVAGQVTNSGYIGGGVDVSGISRAYNALLTRESVNATSLAAMDSTRLTQLSRLENVFKTGEQGLGYITGQLFTSMADLASNPGDLATRQVVLSRAADMATRFASAGATMDDLQAGVTADLKTAVGQINSLSQSIASSNQRLAALNGTGLPANDLLDERDRLISQLAALVPVSTVDAGDGTVSVFIGGGQSLVLGNQAKQLKVVQDNVDPTRSAVGIVDGSAVRPLQSSLMSGGTVGGLLSFQNGDLAQARNLVGQLALSVGSALNEQQLRGISLAQPLGSATTLPMFQLGAPQSIPNAGNARDSSGVAIGSVALTITDASAVRASDYQLRESSSNPGQWELTRLSDGVVRPVSSGDVIDGMRIDLNNVQSGDSFLLQPASRAANGMKALLSDPRDIAAASPLVASVGGSNTGTATISSLTVNSSPLPVAGATARISFLSDNGDYSWDLLDSSNNVVASGVGTWVSGQPLPPASADINGFSLQLAGMPRSGDTLTVEPTPASSLASNNGNALSMLSLRDAPISAGSTYTDSWSHAVADIGVRAQSAQTASDLSLSVAQQVESERSSEAGVNLDEEAAKLIQFQQSYQAAAKMLQVAQTLLDSLLQIAK
jgi:flagellar hook-associated protein 1 FlgK